MTEQQKIRRAHLRLKQTIEKAYQSMKELQENCGHPDVKRTYRSDTGNYDRSSDRYWIEFECPDAGNDGKKINERTSILGCGRYTLSQTWAVYFGEAQPSTRLV